METNTQVVSFEQIREWVAHGKTEAALDALALKAGDFDTEASLLSARFENLKMRIIGGTISEENRNVETNSINEAALALTDEIQEHKGKKKKTAPVANGKAGVVKRSASFLGNSIKWMFIFSIAIAVALPSILKSMKKSTAAVERIEVRNSFGEPGNESSESFYIDQDVANNEFFDIKVTNMSWNAHQIILEIRLRNYSESAIQIPSFELTDVNTETRVMINEADSAYSGIISLESEEIKKLEMKFDHVIGDSKVFALGASFDVPGTTVEEEWTTLFFQLMKE